MKKILEIAENIIRKIVSCRLLYYVVVMLLFIGTYYINLKIKLENNAQTGGTHLKYFLIAAAVSGIIVLALIIFSKKLYQKIEPHIVYLILALTIGGIYIFIIPFCVSFKYPHSKIMQTTNIITSITTFFFVSVISISFSLIFLNIFAIYGKNTIPLTPVNSITNIFLTVDFIAISL